MRKRLIIGLTGNFGSGKSTVAGILKRLGAQKVIDCDQIAHEVFRPGHRLRKKIRSLFGPKTSLSRRAMAKKVFSDSHKRKQLEQVIHPYVYERIDSELKRLGRGIVVLEVPLLFETGFDRLCDVTIAVLAGKGRLVKRLSRAGFSSEEVRARLRAQLSEREKVRRADFYIRNSGSKDWLIRNTKSVWQKIKADFK